MKSSHSASSASQDTCGFTPQADHKVMSSDRSMFGSHNKSGPVSNGFSPINVIIVSLRRLCGNPDGRAHSDQPQLTGLSAGSRAGQGASKFQIPELIRDILSVAFLFGMLFALLWLPEVLRVFGGSAQ